FELFGVRRAVRTGLSGVFEDKDSNDLSHVLYFEGQERVKADLRLEQRHARVQCCSLPGR
ncbi:MAG: hypothetical protein ACK56F_11250, partial [bacterium]